MEKLGPRKAFFLFGLVALLFTGCAGPAGLGMSFGRANFTMGYDSRDRNTVSILDYNFSHKGQPVYAWPPDFVRRGVLAGQGSSTGYYYPPDTLRVRWQLKESGELFEERVSLEGLLPSNMEDRILYFIVWDKQLNVYLAQRKRLGSSMCGKSRSLYQANGRTFKSADEVAVFNYCNYPLYQIYPAKKLLTSE